MYLQKFSARMKRAIVGGPKTGKTTLAPNALHTDDYIAPDYTWTSDATRTVADAFATSEAVEGTRAAHALREWLRTHPEGKPVDEVVWLRKPHEPLTRGQQIQTKGIDTVMREIVPELERRGVRIKENPNA
jgi:hypothetical protein